MKQCPEQHGADMSIFKKALGSMKKSTLTLMVLSLSLLAAEGAYAMNARNLVSTEFGVGDSEMPVAISLSTGVLNGETNEYLYNNYYGDDRRVSKLVWDIDDVYMIGAETSVGISEKFNLNFGIWSNLSEGTGNVTDRDWAEVGGEFTWTDYSEHNTDLEEALMLDANLDYVILKDKNYKLSGIFGFRHDKFSWDAYDGKGVWSSSAPVSEEDNFRSQDVIFYGKTLAYKQELYAPYLGLDFDYNRSKWSFSTHIRGSLWAWGDSEDKHYDSTALFTLNKDLGSIAPKGAEKFHTSDGSYDVNKDEVENVQYISCGAGVKYNFTEQFSAGVSAEFQKYYSEEDDDKVTKIADDGKEYETWGGMSHESYMFSCSATYLF